MPEAAVHGFRGPEEHRGSAAVLEQSRAECLEEESPGGRAALIAGQAAAASNPQLGGWRGQMGPRCGCWFGPSLADLK